MRVERADYDDNWMHVAFGMTEQNIEVDVPANARVEIQKSSGATIAGLRIVISMVDSIFDPREVRRDALLTSWRDSGVAGKLGC